MSGRLAGEEGGLELPLDGPAWQRTSTLFEVERPLPTGLDRDALRARPRGLWRFRELVDPDLAPAEIITLEEGDTALLDVPDLARWCGVEQLAVKHEGRNPTGSFKDRGMTVAVSRARRAGARVLVCASTGNTAASLAAYAARAGLRAAVVVPQGKTASGKLGQTLAFGARVLEVRGDFDAAMRLVRELAHAEGIALLNSANPFRVEGQKTCLFEVLEARGWRAPDWFVFPAGNLGNAAAFGKALRELRALGWIDRAPRLAAVQASGAAPFAAAFERGFDELRPVHAETVATAIRIGDPVSYRRAVRALRETDGVALAVDDDAILAAKVRVDRAGIGAEPASCASVAGVRALVERGLARPGDDVVALLTGHLLKDPETTLALCEGRLLGGARANRPCPVEARLDDVVRALEEGPA